MWTGLFTHCGWDNRAPNAAGATGRVARRTKLGDDGNQIFEGVVKSAQQAAVLVLVY